MIVQIVIGKEFLSGKIAKKSLQAEKFAEQHSQLDFETEPQGTSDHPG
jgi:hypothetical protein